MAKAAPAAFTGFSPQALRFLRELKKNNDRAWFAPRKELYERECLAPLRALTVGLAAALRKARIPIDADQSRVGFRIYRDVRFSPDKSPYKTNLGTYLPYVLRALERNCIALSDQSPALKRMPRGFEALAESPIALYFKIGTFIVSEKLSDRDLAGASLIEKSLALVKRAKPLLEYGWDVLG